ncbi:MAG: AsnC family transcriptional regulator [Deltaproteobacteria bacterium]|nr:AsnC family transcriptional regulator [Deltaproteobacteria bacterium]MBW2051668.1 AsnC family transcriptional regulator [Deltaproteobacteria bacterium]MBW2140241.1 AsnC family transcriptional regulator [Deltaproteobacteria bacterium]MBW2323439.1 AsnC family transcriptional regulator [Deltaproteobacteria bacterium]
MLSETERAILNQIQSDYPIEARPYLVLAERLGLTETEVLETVRRLRASGVIRRIGGNFSARNLGYTSTLCAARVPEDRLKAFIAEVNQYTGVTHNYLRNHDLNVWFTFIAPSMEEIEKNLAAISEATGVRPIYNLPADKIFKIKVDFQFEE